MTKAELVDQVAATVQLPKHQTEAVITRFLQAIMDALHTGESVELRALGVSIPVTASRVLDATHAQETRSRFRPKQIPAFTAGKAFQALVQTGAETSGNAADVATHKQTTYW